MGGYCIVCKLVIGRGSMSSLLEIKARIVGEDVPNVWKMRVEERVSN